MKILAIETATEACSVALWLDGECLERFELAPRRHALRALPMAEELLAEAGIGRRALDGLACGRGPGAFTGVRLAVALTQGLALALDRPVAGVSTLAALACAAPGSGSHVLATIDARMGEVYAGLFQRDQDAPLPLGPERVLAPEQLELPGAGTWSAVGTGLAAAGGALLERLEGRLEDHDASALPRAADVARLAAGVFRDGGGMDAAALEPAYLRDRVALTLAEQASARTQR